MNPLQHALLEIAKVNPALVLEPIGVLALHVSNYLDAAQAMARKLDISLEVIERVEQMAENAAENAKVEFFAAVLYLSAQCMAMCTLAIEHKTAERLEHCEPAGEA